MNLRILTKSSQSRNRKQSWPIFYAISRSFSNLSPQSTVPSFGVAFDIDGVVLRGEKPIGGSPQALKRLYHDSGSLRIPYIFLTNGGGFRESIRALELSQLLGLDISSAQVVQGHTPFKQLVNRYENDLVVAVGKGEPASVMSEYGFKNVISIDDYASCFENIDPLASYKRWITKQPAHQNEITNMVPKIDVCSQRVHAAFVVSDSVDWSRDIQVLCDILRTGGHPGRRSVNQQPQLYFANDDLAYQAAFPVERLGMGAFRIALESVFNGVHPYALEYTSYGKPNPSVFKNAEIVLKHLVSSLYDNVEVVDHKNDLGHHFKTLYMIGDNPSVDINGAKQAGHPWFSILTRSGVFKEKENHAKYPADLVVDTVEEAVDYILTKECISESGKLH